jgi:Endonuclease/Exonuclease/phosphatase family
MRSRSAKSPLRPLVLLGASSLLTLTTALLHCSSEADLPKPSASVSATETGTPVPPKPTATTTTTSSTDSGVPSDAATDSNEPSKDAGPADAAPKPTSGRFKIMAYNVAGLPQGLSSSNPSANTKQISPRLNAFDFVAVQEDFSYHADLISQATHLYRTTPKTNPSLGDGLNVLSKIPFTSGPRTPWKDCNGLTNQANDCLTAKGYHRMLLPLGNTVVHVYNMHADAGRSEKDQETRIKQMDQLLATLAVESKDQPLIVLGDTNMKEGDEAQLQKLLMGAGLSDACRVTNCPEPARIDRIMFRNTSAIELTVDNFNIELGFVDSKGEQLSDHEPVWATMSWKTLK